MEKSISGSNINSKKQVKAPKRSDVKKAVARNVLKAAQGLKKKKLMSRDQAIASLHK